MNKTDPGTRGILLDLDGTIVDSRRAYFEAARTACQAFGNKIPDLQTSLEIPRRLELQQPLNDVAGTAEKDFLGVYLKRFYAITFEMTKPFPNVEKTLKDLSRKAKLALITMRFVPRTAIVAELKHFGLADYFAYVVTALDTQNPKPSPEALVRAARLMHVKSCDCLVVGDSVTDIKAGKAAGIATVGVLSGLFSREELALESPDLILDSVAQLPHYVDSLQWRYF